MGVVNEEESKSKYIRKSVRNALKRMGYMSNIASCIALAPKPEDFVTNVIGQVTLMVERIMTLSDKINEIMEDYSNLPSDYLINSTNAVLGTLSEISKNVSDVTGETLDKINSLSEDVESFTNDVTDSINDLTGGSYSSTTGNISGAVSDGVASVKDLTDNVSSTINEKKEQLEKWSNGVKDKVQNIVDRINEKMMEINDSLNENFRDFVSVDDYVGDIDDIAERYSNEDTAVGKLASTTLSDASSVIKNFNIGKITTGFIGMATNFLLVETCLSQLPEINTDKLMEFGKSEINKFKNGEFGSFEFLESKKYSETREKLEKDKSELRDKIRGYRKKSVKELRETKTQEELKKIRDEYKSVAKQIRKDKAEAKKAKMIAKHKSLILTEIRLFADNMKTYGRNIKDEWDYMYSSYSDAVNQIKSFFTGSTDDAYGARDIDKYCDKIEDDCKKIITSGKNIGSVFTMSVTDVCVPAVIGTAFDNPAHKVLAFFKSCKLVTIEIAKMILNGVDIMKQVYNIGKLIYKDYEDFKKVKKEILELLDIEWIIDFIDSIVDLFSAKCKEGKELIENTLSPIYYNETDEYEAEVDALENLANGGVVDNVNLTSVTYKNYNNVLDRKAKDRDKVKINIDKDTHTIEDIDDDGVQDKISDAMDLVEDKGENVVVAYKSPLLNEEGTDLKGWIFYHPSIDDDLRHKNNINKRITRNIIKRAAKTSRRKKGGKNFLLSKDVSKRVTKYTKAYDAFYWYTKYTKDPLDDGVLLGNTEDIVTPLTTTENGTLVKLEDGRKVFVNDFGVKSGDIVIVEGKKYRVV